MDHQEYIRKFRYKSENKDRWSLSTVGDCEDFSLSVLWLLCDRSWFRLWWWISFGYAAIWFTKTNGNGHVMLWVSDRGWIDNIHPTWSEKPKHKKIFPHWTPLLVLVLLFKYRPGNLTNTTVASD